MNLGGFFSTMSPTILRRLALVAIGAALLLWAPAVNRYPFVHVDTGTYLWASVRFQVPQDRPIGYSLWVRFADLASPIRRDNAPPSAPRRVRARNSLANSLWSVVLWQALGTSYLAVTLAEIVLARARRRSLLVLVVLFLTALTTAVSVYVGAVMPDILTGWLYLGAVVFLLAPSRIDQGLSALLFAVSLAAHNSHLPLAVLSLALVVAPLLLTRRRRAIWVRRIMGLGLVTSAAVSVMLAINLILGAGPGAARGSNTILLNRFAESGVLSETLAQECPSQNWVLCQSRDLIAAHQGEVGWYLFDTSSPIGQVGWDKGTVEQSDVIASALACCLDEIIRTSALESWKQFWLIRIQPHYIRLDEHWNAVNAIREIYPSEYNAFQAGIQQSSGTIFSHVLPPDEQESEWVVLALGVLLFGVCIHTRRRREAWLLYGCAVFLGANAVLVATTSHAVARYQGRVFWLLPYFIFLVGLALLDSRFFARGESVAQTTESGAWLKDLTSGADSLQSAAISQDIKSV